MHKGYGKTGIRVRRTKAKLRKGKPRTTGGPLLGVGKLSQNCDGPSSPLGRITVVQTAYIALTIRTKSCSRTRLNNCQKFLFMKECLAPEATGGEAVKDRKSNGWFRNYLFPLLILPSKLQEYVQVSPGIGSPLASSSNGSLIATTAIGSEAGPTLENLPVPPST